MGKKSFCKSRLLLPGLIVTALLIVFGCRRPTPDAQPQTTPGTSPSPAAAASPASEAAGEDLSVVAVRILNQAHRGGGIMLRGQCGPQGIAEQYKLPASATLEPMDKALAEISAKYQNIYWRESRSSGVRVADSSVQAKLLAVRLREFRIVEDREPDRVMQALWHAPGVQSFLRRNRIRFARRPDGARKAISAPMILEMNNHTVAEILDRMAGAYGQDPPKVWIYQECTEGKDTLVDVRMR